ncbi:YciI family protein [Pantoea sp. DY-15]|uniref:YciI family protein n=1 Tax=Pantoea sp. DY-15 TaxID=2871489 RepID=UPI001C97A55C|nr:YciI family protein [Pantoea sp. DY-15]MBY4890646.1 YciI family protein [Pantoea sp. DY-15]
MKTFLCKWIPPRPDFLATMSDDEKRWMGQHGAFQNDLLDEGVIIAHGPVIDDNGGYGVSIYRIADQEDIADFTSQDPIVKNGVGHYEHFTMLHVTSKF